MAFCGDGQRLISAGGRMIKIWDHTNGQLLLERECTWPVALNQNRTWAAWHEQQLIRVWKVDADCDGIEVPFRDRAAALAVSSDGSRLATASGTSVTLWDLPQASRRLVLRSPLLTPPGIQCMAFSTEGKLLAAAYTHSNVAVWDTETGELITMIKTGQGSVESLVFSSDDKRLATADFAGTARLWDLASGEALVTFQGHADAVRSVAFSPDGQRLATAGNDRTVRVWDVQQGRELVTLRGHRQGVSCVAFSPDGTKVVSGSRDGTVKVWNSTAEQESTVLAGHSDWVAGLAFQEDGEQIVSVGFDQSLRIWNSVTGREVHAVSKRNLLSAILSRPFLYRSTALGGGREGNAVTIIGAAMSADGQMLATDVNDAIAIWNATNGQLVRLIGDANTHVPVLAWSADGRLLASAVTIPIFGGVTEQSCTVTLWDVESGAQLWSRVEEGTFVARLCFSADGRHIAGGGGTVVRVWDASEGREVQTLNSVASGAASSIGFCPDSRLLAAGHTDGTIALWDYAASEAPDLIRAHDSHVTALVFSPNGRRLASGGIDRGLKLWDLSTRDVALTLVMTGEITGLAFSPDGQQLAASNSSGRIQVWVAPPAAAEIDAAS